MRNAWMISMTLSAALFSGCLGAAGFGPGDGGGGGGDDGGAGDDGGGGGDDGGPGPECAVYRSYAGFGGAKLEADRITGTSELDRDRVKPYEVLATEYTRMLGKKPPLIDTMATTFGSSPARFYVEPEGSAVTLYSAYRVAFEGCIDFTATATEYAAAPTTASATDVCNALATRFWSRTPEQHEIDACVKTAVTDTASEGNARRRWGYTCAAVLSAAGFLTY